MQLPRDAVLLRIFFGEDDKFDRLPLHEAIVRKAREMCLGGATVLRGHIGFGHSSHIHTTKILRLSQDLPVVVEIVDLQDKIDAFLPVLDGMMSSGLVHHREGSGPSIRHHEAVSCSRKPAGEGRSNNVTEGNAAMDLNMTGKKALVTGASEGIGKAITLAFAREGVDVAICARRKEPLEQTAAEIARETGRKIVPIARRPHQARGRRKLRQTGRTRRWAGSISWSTMPVRLRAACSNI